MHNSGQNDFNLLTNPTYNKIKIISMINTKLFWHHYDKSMYSQLDTIYVTSLGKNIIISSFL